MTDHRIPIDQPNPGTDYVLEGAGVRDRFLTAFILKHGETFFQEDRVHPIGAPGGELGLSLLLAEIESETLGGDTESPEPLRIELLRGPFGDDDET